MLRLLTALLIFASCGLAEMKVFPAKGVDFKQFKTYEIMTPRLATKMGIQDDDTRFAPLAEKSPQPEAIVVIFN